MSEIISDIEEIIKLAKKVEAHLDRGKISKAKREIKAIANIDINEYKRIKTDFGDKRLLEQCIQVLTVAKKALRELGSLELIGDAKELMSKIIQIESHELLEANEDEKKENELYNFWHEHYFKAVVYHGTTSLAVDRIRRYGLVPGIYPWEKHDLDGFVELIEKVGSTPWVKKYRLEITQSKTIHLTGRREDAIGYARDMPEIISRLINPNNIKRNDIQHALKDAYYELLYAAFARNRFTYPQADEITNLIGSDKAKFLRWVTESTKLTQAEINEFERIFFRIWNQFRQHRPIVLTISIQAPPILAQFPLCRNFKEFLKEYIRFYPVEVSNKIDISVKEIIPAKYILNIEYAD